MNTTTARDRALLGPTTYPAIVSAPGGSGGSGHHYHFGGVSSVLQPEVHVVLPVATPTPTRSGTAPGSSISMAAILMRETEQ
eukprot:CAMPEP_0171012116 /NCGR_PEP_ID=MMETSP0736-20130129/23359_1 /TAXON_ID=186038 /ORGANISM="Fragilariopsis kerguelensis, Strain L26-C5" /LENGTH=81 /DNA_ID=CAMNT_0011445127 /DNA_START=361 /DNA_END=606 /DNA_ORIENTATION=+